VWVEFQLRDRDHPTSSANRSIGRSGLSPSAPVGHADTQARQSVQPAASNLDCAERRTGRQRHHLDRGWSGPMKFAQGEAEHIALAANGRKTCRPRCWRCRDNRPQLRAEHVRIVNLDRSGAPASESQTNENYLGEPPRRSERCILRSRTGSLS